MSKEPPKPIPDANNERIERELDEELENTFPASDPPKLTRIPSRNRITGDEEEGEERKQGR